MASVAGNDKQVLLRRVKAVAIAMMTVQGVALTLFPPLLAYFSQLFGLSPFGSGLMVGVYMVGVILGGVLAPLLVNIVTLKPLAMITVGLAALGMLITGLSDSFPVLGVGRAIAGFGNSLLWITSFTWVLLVYDGPGSPRALSAVVGLSSLGNLLGPLVGPLAIKHGFDTVFFAVLAYAGLRPSEAWGLRWEDLDNERLRVWASKTGRQRYVMIREPLAAYLEEWKGISTESGRDAELMFDARDHRAWVRRHFRPAVAAAGLPSRTRPYDLRHTCASLLVAEHRSVVEAAEWMGHAPTLFLNTYAHVMERHRGGGRLDVDQAIRQARIAAETKPVWSDSDQIPLLEGETSSRRGDSNP